MNPFGFHYEYPNLRPEGSGQPSGNFLRGSAVSKGMKTALIKYPELLTPVRFRPESDILDYVVIRTASMLYER